MLEKICWIVIVAALFSFLLTFPGCKNIDKLVNNETVKYDTVYISKNHIDSIYMKDSIYLYKIADTVYSIKYKYLYNTRIKYDTVYKQHIDTVVNREVITNTVEVDKPLSLIQKSLMTMGIIFSVIAIIAGIIFLKKH